MPPSAGRGPTRHRTLHTTTRFGRAAVAAVLLVLTVSATPAPGARALRTSDTSPASEPFRLGAIAAATLRPGPAPVADTPDLRIPVTPLTAGARSAAAAAAGTGATAVRTRETAPPKVVRAAARPAAMWAQLRRGLTVTGRATWYGATRGYADVAHVAMAGARYLPRGRSAPKARVCVDGRCAVLPVVDFCGCHVGSARARIVDLSAAALRRLGLDPSRGVYRVRVTLVTT
jgi:hypothetical protein